MNRTQNCAECEFMKTYDYGKKIYYCDNEDRTDKMGNPIDVRVPEPEYMYEIFNAQK